MKLLTILLSLAVMACSSASADSDYAPAAESQIMQDLINQTDRVCVLTVFVPGEQSIDQKCLRIFENNGGHDFWIVSGSLNGTSPVWIKVCGARNDMTWMVHELYYD
jgi:hypothetical protein